MVSIKSDWIRPCTIETHPQPERMATSPSLRRKRVADASEPPTEAQVAVGQLLANNNDLWPLLVAAIVGKHEYNPLMAALYATCREARDDVRTAQQSWRGELDTLRDEVVAKTMDVRLPANAYGLGTNQLEQSERALARAVVRFEAVLDGAFGHGFVHNYGLGSCMCSVYSPRVVCAMKRRVCVLCDHHLMGDREVVTYNRMNDAVRMGQYTFAHARCLLEHCVTVGNVDNPQRMHTGGKITHRWREWIPGDLFAAMCTYGRGPHAFSPTNYVTYVNSPNVATFSEPPGGPHTEHALLWVKPCTDVVRWRDTVAGALGIDAAELQRCIQQGRLRAATMKEAMERKRLIGLRAETERVQARAGDVRLRLGMLHSSRAIPWATIEEVRALHPRALERTLIQAYVHYPGLGGVPRQASANQVGLERVVEAVMLLGRLCKPPFGKLGPATLDFVMADDGLWSAWSEARHNQGLGAILASMRLTRAVDFVHMLDAFTKDDYLITRVRVSSDQRHWRVSAEVRWARAGSRPINTALRVVHTTYTLARSDLVKARARLEELGVDGQEPLFRMQPPTVAEVALNAMINEGLKTNVVLRSGKRYAVHPGRGIAYELLGMSAALNAQMRGVPCAGVD